MTPEQQSAYIISMAVCAMIDALGMQAENQLQIANSSPPSFNAYHFKGLIEHHGIHHNAVIAFFQGRL